MDEPERLSLMEEMGSFLRAAVFSIGIKHNAVVRFPGLFQIMDTGVDVVWRNASDEQEAEWQLKVTYTEINMLTGEESRVTEIVITSPVTDTAAMARAAVITIAEHLVDSALSEVITE